MVSNVQLDNEPLAGIIELAEQSFRQVERSLGRMLAAMDRFVEDVTSATAETVDAGGERVHRLAPQHSLDLGARAMRRLAEDIEVEAPVFREAYNEAVALSIRVLLQ